MRFFLTLALVFGTTAGVYAQSGISQPADSTHSWSLGLNAGASWNTRPANGSSDDKSGVLSGIAGLGLYCHINRRWEMGAAADYRLLNIRSFDRLRFEDDFNPVTGMPTHEPSYYNKTVYYPAITGKLLVNYHFIPASKADVYAGLSAGYLVILKDAANERNSLQWKVQSGTNSFVPGLYIGVNYPVSRHWLLNAQLGGEGVFIDRTRTHLNVISTTGTLGVRFRF